MCNANGSRKTLEVLREERLRRKEISPARDGTRLVDVVHNYYHLAQKVWLVMQHRETSYIITEIVEAELAFYGCCVNAIVNIV